MVEGFHWGIVVVSLDFSNFRALLLIFLDCYFSFIIWWFMYCSVVFAAVERNILMWFGGGFFGWCFFVHVFFLPEVLLFLDRVVFCSSRLLSLFANLF